MTDTAAKTLPAPPPQINVETKTFWDATAEGKLMLPRCNACQVVIWYPRQFCPECGSTDIGWFEASGKGTVYSYTINRRGQGDYRDLAYVVAYVELEEGPRVLTNIVDCDVDQVSVGQAVQVVFHPTSNGAALPRFRPA
ncbi:MAG: Zn-ribbon domain-containing OB-fold protein [Chloroflexi bacterium]|nr:Zn-ribbon domain-containing OB-fold protein [Chloroflexota bacterium]